MRFVIFPSKLAARRFSRLLWAANHNRPRTQTTQAVPILVHPKSGAIAIGWPDNFKLRPHPLKNIDADIDRDLPAWAADFKAILSERRSKDTGLAEFLPTTLKTQTLTRAQMETAGWFPLDN